MKYLLKLAAVKNLRQKILKEPSTMIVGVYKEEAVTFSVPYMLKSWTVFWVVLYLNLESRIFHVLWVWEKLGSY